MQVNNWQTRKLSELCDINIGKTPSRSNLEYWNGNLKWVSISDMKGKFITQTKECITEKGAKESNSKLVPENTLLMSFKLSIGKLAFTTEPVYTNEAIASLKIKDDDVITNEYLYYVLQTIDLTAGSDKAVKGLTLNKAKLNELKIPYPSKEEQEKIVSILDKADEIRAKKKLANDKLDEFLKSTFISMFGDPVRNEKNLTKVCIDYIKASEKNSIVDGPFGSSLKNEDYYESGIPIIRINNIRPCRFYNDEFKYIKESKYEQLIRSKVDYGDVLMARVGNTIGKSCLYDQHKKALLSTTGVCKITCDNTKIINKFLLLQMNMDTYREYIVRQVKGAGQPCLNLTTIKNFNIILPPIEQQRKYVQIVEQVEAQKQKNELVIEQMNNLFNSLSQRAFKGGL